MLQSAWLLLGLLGAGATALAALRERDDGLMLVFGAVGFVAWGLFAYGALEVEVVGDAVTYSFSMPAVAMFGVLAALVPGYLVLVGPAELVSDRVRKPRQEDL